jgi:hypothetical protein
LAFLAFALIGIVAVQLYSEPARPSHAFHVDIPPPLESEIGNRDISRYDFGGKIGKCSAILDTDENEEKAGRCFQELEKARTFIEEHFTNRRRGYVIIDSPNVQIGMNHIFIEPGTDSEDDDWEIRIRKRVPAPHTRFNRNVNTWFYTEVFRRRIRKGDAYFKEGTNVLVLHSRRVYELIL